MLFVYPAIFHNEDDSYWVEFPDLEGCQTYGSTIEETIELANEALGLYLASLIDNDKKLNKPTSIKDYKVDDGFVSYVSTDPYKYSKKNRAVKKTLTIPEWLNDEAEKYHINFSSVLKDALIDKLNAIK